ncbi:MAG: SusC/RagA family TonB-linked outer membrane protein [Bacteroidota bacterium]|nr:SusC/RagA family TonB-linked outer membrane protein [Bacteroidota bacterium]MDP4248678.1 SusC/RagA family TonB-linked outer membrane protein [Bacteroidota bacterium]
MHKSYWLILMAIGLLSCVKVRSQEITLSYEQASLHTLFMEIHQQSGYFFYYSEKDLARSKPVTIHVVKAPLERVLAICFTDQPLTYTLEDKIIVVKKKQPEPATRDTKLDIGGRVTDTENQPIVGANVTVNQHEAIETDDQGFFQMHDLDIGAELLISSAGYEPQTIRIGNNHILRVVLNHAIGNLDEVQVIAYGTTTRRLNTGSISSVSSKDIQPQPVSNPLAALTGEVPGLAIIQNTGVPGGSFSVQIRGQNSVLNGTTPLYIIDGVPYGTTVLGSQIVSAGINFGGNPLNSINPLDIESISVLKDADATAIYGSRGANGVILITTRKGKAGKTRFDVNAYTGWENVFRRLPVLNTRQYLDMREEAFRNDGEMPVAGVDVDLLDWDTTRNTDWQKMLIGGTALASDVQGSISGGNEHTQFTISGNYHRETTVFPGDYQDRKISGHAGLNHSSQDQKLSLAFVADYSQVQTNLPVIDITQLATTVPPDAPDIYDAYGKLNWANGYFNNPFSIFQTSYLAGTNNLISNLNLGYQLAPRLLFRINAGMNSISLNEFAGYPTTSFNPAYGLTSGVAYSANTKLDTWILEPQLEYKQDFSFGHLNFLIGGTLNDQTFHQQNLLATGFSSDNLLENISAASSIASEGTQDTHYKYEAVFGRINYQYKDKYLLNLTARRDGSSRFGPGKQFANFGALGAGWVFSKEAFILENIPQFSFGKLRVSYGSTGNDQIGDYQYLDTWSPSFYPYLQGSTLLPTRLYNPDYSWELTRKLEMGIDLGLLGNRLLITVDYYRNRSSNQLIPYSLPVLTGFTSVQTNLPATVQNSGLELEINTVNVKGKFFSWTSGITLTIPRTELVSYPNLASSPYANTYQTGEPLKIRKVFHFLGVNPLSGLDEFEDVNKDGLISYPNDLSRAVSLQPKYYGGLRNHFEYGNWSVDCFFYFVHQNGANYLDGSYISPGMMSNQPVWVLDRWQTANDHRSIEMFTQDYSSAAYGAFSHVPTSDRVFSDASFIRLKNVNVSYRFPKKLNKIMHIAEGRIYVLGQNLITITHYQGMDPENQNLQALPPLRVFTGGIQLTL